MMAETTGDLRERVATLEAENRHISNQLEELTQIVKRIDKAFEQAKGAKWVLVGLAGIGGFFAGKLGALAALFGFAK